MYGSPRKRILLLLLCALAVPRAVQGEGVVKLNHVLSLYSDGNGGPLRNPEDTAWLPDGRLLVADTGNGRLLLYTLRTGEKPGAAGVIADPRIPYPVNVESDAAGNLLVLDGRQKKMFHVRQGGGVVEEFAPQGLPPGLPPAVKSFALDHRGSLFLLDVANASVWVLAPDGAYQRRIPFPPDCGFASDLAVDDVGNVFLLDSVGARVFTAGPNASGFQPVTGRLKDRVRFPTRILVGGGGRIYVLDGNGASLLILRRDGSFIGRQSGRGWKDGLLVDPGGMSLDVSGTLAVADTGNHRVQVFSISR